MRYGFYLPTRGPTATRDGILALAREGERLGLHSAMIADHIVLPVESQSTYPYTLDGKHPSVGDALETFSILGVVAGATERLRLVTSVLVLPYRNPVLTAKVVASLDVLSGGRLTLGIGAGCALGSATEMALLAQLGTLIGQLPADPLSDIVFGGQYVSASSRTWMIRISVRERAHELASFSEHDFAGHAPISIGRPVRRSTTFAFT